MEVRRRSRIYVLSYPGEGQESTRVDLYSGWPGLRPTGSALRGGIGDFNNEKKWPLAGWFELRYPGDEQSGRGFQRTYGNLINSTKTHRYAPAGELGEGEHDGCQRICTEPFSSACSSAPLSPLTDSPH